MEMVDLRIAPTRHIGLDLPRDDWWVEYLAWLASTPRNWIERRLEPLVQCPGSHLRVIDEETPEEAGIADGVYPTSGLRVWWTIVCLDGAPERMKYLLGEQQQFSLLALTVLRLAEDRFGLIITDAAQGLAAQPVVYVSGDWRDGVILGFEMRSSAEDFASRVADACTRINRAEQLPWTKQFHVRAGTGLSLREAFSGLLQAKRDEHYMVGRALNETAWGSILTPQKLVG